MAAKRRSKGDGQIYQRPDGYWVFRKRSKRGARVLTARTKSDLLRRIERIKEKPVGERLLLGPYLDRWIEDKNDIRESVKKTYAWAAEKIKPILGRVRLDALNQRVIQDAYRDLLYEGSSPQTIRKVHVMLSSALTEAERLEHIPKNFCRLVKPPKVEREEVEVWTPEQAATFLEKARGHKYYLFFVLMLAAGIRPGELFALRWQNVDLRNGSISITRNLENIEGRRKLVDTKSRAGRRLIALSASVLPLLRDYHKAEGQPKDGFVFHDSKGGALQKSSFRNRVWVPLLEAIGFEPVRMYVLRHTHATLLGAHEVAPKLAQERLGHSSVSTTLDIYTHALPNAQKAVAAAIDPFFKSALKAPNKAPKKKSEA